MTKSQKKRQLEQERLRAGLIALLRFELKPDQPTDADILSHRCPVCGGPADSPPGTGCGTFHYGTYCGQGEG